MAIIPAVISLFTFSFQNLKILLILSQKPYITVYNSKTERSDMQEMGGICIPNRDFFPLGTQRKCSGTEFYFSSIILLIIIFTNLANRFLT